MMMSVRAMMVALNLDICKKGDYQIFAYQDNPSVASGTDEVLVQVNANEKNQVIILDTIYIDKY